MSTDQYPKYMDTYTQHTAVTRFSASCSFLVRPKQNTRRVFFMLFFLLFYFSISVVFVLSMFFV